VNRRTGPLLALLCAVVLSGCASGNPAAGGETSAGTAGTHAKTTAAPAVRGRVVAVSLRRSGGFVPRPLTRVFAAGEAPPRGFTGAEVKTVLRAAQALVDADLKVKPLPSNTCCDRYVYSVWVVLSDGTTKTYGSVDGINQPRLFTVLLRLLA
jgi:hypothetical protein